MSRISHREKYINCLLKIAGNINEIIRTEISEVTHDRGIPSEELKNRLIYEIENGFESGTKYRNGE